MQIQPVATVSPALPVAPASDATTPTTTAAAATVHLLNPRPVIDPGLGIVVTEYFSKAGVLTEQYPTAKALDNYRIYGLHGSAASAASDMAKGGSRST